MPLPTTRQIAAHVHGTLLGQGDLVIRGIDSLELAGPDQITFIRDASHARHWHASRAGAVLVGPGVTVEPGPARAVISVADADLAVAAVLSLFAPPPARPPQGVHQTAVIDPSASLGAAVAIGPCACIGPGVRIGDRCVIHAGVTILDHTILGADCELFPGVVVRDRCALGDRVILHPNVVIGADGFNYRPGPGGKGLVKIPHIGTVKIGDDVEIGAGTCVDRGKFSATVLGDGTKIDNLCQIAHNCVIGRRCVIAGQSGLAGSVTLGDDVMLGGKVAVRDHVVIGSRVRIAATSAVMTDVPPGEAWGGYPAQDIRLALREAAAVRKLPELIKEMRKKP